MKDNRSKVQRLYLYIVLCISFVVLLINSTVAYFMDQSTTSNDGVKLIIIGTLDLDVTTNFNFKNLALAPDTLYLTDYEGEDIGTYIKTSDDHDIYGAYVRVRFTTKRHNVGEPKDRVNLDLLDLYFTPDEVTTNTSYSEQNDKDKWFYNSADNYYYYIGAVEDEFVRFNTGYKTSNYMTNVEKDAPVEIEILVESIQRQYDAYADVWTTAPAIFNQWAVKDKEAKWGQL